MKLVMRHRGVNSDGGTASANRVWLRLGRLSMPGLICGVGVSVTHFVLGHGFETTSEKTASRVPMRAERQNQSIPFDLEDVRDLTVVSVDGTHSEAVGV